jgi:alpha-ketoglutarate-dependent taurine dioxygenase
MSSPDSIDVRRVAGNIGAEVSGVRVGPDLPGPVVNAIRSALHEHKVLFFRDQHHLDDAGQAGFAELMGELTKAHAANPRVGAADHILEMDSHHGGKAPAWHTDATYTDRPPAITMLRSVMLPPYGGDTAWANTAAAYQAMGPKLREIADGLRAIHSNGHAADDKRAGGPARPANSRRANKPFYETEHPVVRVHPETGERTILLGIFASRIVDREDSAKLIDLFQAIVTRLENTVRWRWSLGDFAMWDNRATQHYAIHDYGDLQRKMHRCTLAGEIPVGVDGRRSVALAGDASSFAAAANV